MADMIPNQPWQSDLQAAQRRRQIAQALMQGVMTPNQGQMVGRYYVGPGIGDGLVKIGNALLASKLNTQADATEQGAIASQLAAKNKAMGDFLSAIRPQEQTQMVPTGNMLTGQDSGARAVLPMGNGPSAISMGAPTVSYSYPETQAKTTLIKPTPQQIGAALIQAKSAGIDVSPDMIKLLNPEPTKVAQGETLIGADNKPIFSNPKVPDGMMVNSDGSFGWMPNYISGKVEIAKAGRPLTNVNVSNAKYNSKFSETSGEDDAKFLSDLRGQARNAQDTLGTLGQLRDLSDKAFSGRGADAKLGLEQFFGGLGIPMSQEAINSEQFTSVAGKLVLDRIKTLGQNPTDTDREFINKLVPQLGSNPQARKQLIDYMEKKARQTLQDYKDAADYAKQNGNLTGFVGGGYNTPAEAAGNPFDM